MKKCLFGLVMILVAVTMPSEAADPGFYVGLGMGTSSFSIGDFYEDYEPLFFSGDQPGFQFFGGYRIIKFLAVEVKYIDYGSTKNYEQLRQVGYQEIRVGINQWDASVVGLLPLGKKVDIFAKVGGASWSTDVRVVEGPDTYDLSDSGTDITYGLGIDFRFKKVGMRVEGDWLEIPDTSGAFFVSLNVTYNF